MAEIFLGSLINFKGLSKEDKFGISLFLSSFIFLGIMIVFCFKTSIWMDEAFSLLSIQKSYETVINITMNDVHPPLYYFILKSGIDLFKTFNLNVNSVIILSKLISALPIMLLLIFSLFKIRKNFGWLCAGIFAICLTSMPNFMYYAVDIRMYSWALFFVTVCFIYAYEIILESHIKNWMILVLSGVCAAYTHYFAAVSVIFVFLLLLIYFILNNKSEIKKWLLSVLVSFLLYSFWLIPLFNQLLNVTKSYWIGPITLPIIISYLFFMFSPLSSIPYFSVDLASIYYMINNFIGLLFLVIYISIFYCFFKGKNKSQDYFLVSGVLILILTVIFGVSVSFLSKPLFFNRYMFPSLGIFWLVFSFLLSKLYGYTKIFLSILVMVFLISSISTLAFIDYENTVQKDYDVLDSFLKQESIKNDDFVVDGTQTNILPEYHIIKYLLKGYYGIKPSDELNPMLKDNKTLWLFSSESRCEVLKNFENQNVNITKYMICPGIGFSGVYENKPYTIYKISP